MVLTEEDDKSLRGYAKRLNREWGEEAYHNAICDILSQGKWEEIKNMRGFCSVATKYALLKIFRHEGRERHNIEAYLNNDPIPGQVGLVHGRQKHEMCRKGLHPLIEGNLAYIGIQRTCRQCKRERERKK